MSSSNLEQYLDLKVRFTATLDKYLEEFYDQNTMRSQFRKEKVSTTKYSEIVDGKIVENELDEYQTLFFVNQDDIKNLDFVSIRMRFFKECLRNTEKINSTIIQCFEKTGVIHYNIFQTQDLVDFYLKAVREMKKHGRDPNDLIIWPPRFAYALGKELDKAENKQKYRKALQSIDK